MPNFRDALGAPLRLARLLAGAARGLVTGRGAFAQALASADDVLPESIFSSTRLEAWIARTLSRFATDDFRTLGRRLAVTFHDLLRNERIVCGHGGRDDVPIHDAVMASAAIPGIFPPHRVQVDGRPALGVDGGTGGIGLDLKVLDDVDVLICYNCATYPRPRDRHASAAEVLSLAVRLLFNQRTLDEVVGAINASPSKHVLYYEPEDPAISRENSLSASGARRAYPLSIGETARRLARDYDYLAHLLEPRGVRLNPEIGRLDVERALRDPIGLKEEIRRRFAPDAPPFVVAPRGPVPTERARPAPPPAVAPPVPERRIRTLVVDDEPDFLEIVADYLRERPVALVAAGDPDRAIAAAEALEPEVALVDLQMPGGGGERLLCVMRERWPLIQPVIVTAHGSETMAVSLLREKGAVDYLAKHDLDEEKLFCAIRRAALGRDAEIVNRNRAFAVLERRALGPGAVALALAGHLVADARFERLSAFERAVVAEVEAGARHLVLDLRFARAVVPIALGRIMRAGATLAARGGFIALAAPPPELLPAIQPFESDTRGVRLFLELDEAVRAVSTTSRQEMAHRA